MCRDSLIIHVEITKFGTKEYYLREVKKSLYGDLKDS